MAAAVSSGVDETYAGSASLGAALAEHGLDVLDRVLPLPEVAARSAGLLAEAQQAEQIVIGTYNARFHPAQIELVRALQALALRIRTLVIYVMS